MLPNGDVRAVRDKQVGEKVQAWKSDQSRTVAKSMTGKVVSKHASIDSVEGVWYCRSSY